MIICRNCRSSLPDGCRVCTTCGHLTGQFPIRGSGVSDTKDLKKIWIWTIVVASVILLSVGIIAILTVSFQSSTPQPVDSSSVLTLVMSGKAVPGQTVQVVGNHFTTGQTVLVTLDGQPLANNGATTYTRPRSNVNLSLVSLSSTNSGGTPVEKRCRHSEDDPFEPVSTTSRRTERVARHNMHAVDVCDTFDGDFSDPRLKWDRTADTGNQEVCWLPRRAPPARCLPRPGGPPAFCRAESTQFCQPDLLGCE